MAKDQPDPTQGSDVDEASGSLWQGKPPVRRAPEGSAAIPEDWAPAPGQVEESLRSHATTIETFSARVRPQTLTRRIG